MVAATPDVGREPQQPYQALVASNAHVISRFGGRLAVLYQFIEAALAELGPTQRPRVARLFRQRVEDVLSLTDDVEMPAEYHRALLEQTNVLLARLERQDAA